MGSHLAATQFSLSGLAKTTKLESQSKLGTKLVVIPELCKEFRRRISAAISGWDRPLLTFIYPGFDCDSLVVYHHMLSEYHSASNKEARRQHARRPLVDKVDATTQAKGINITLVGRGIAQRGHLC